MGSSKCLCGMYFVLLLYLLKNLRIIAAPQMLKMDGSRSLKTVMEAPSSF